MMLSRLGSSKTRMAIYLLAWLALLGAALISCRASGTETPTSTEEPRATSTDPPTSTPGATATNTTKPTFTPEPTATSTAGPTSTPLPTATEEPRATSTDSPTPTPEATATALPEASAGERYVHESLDTGDVGTNEYGASPPGQSEVLEREYPGAPALIPHSISGLEITKDRNNCLLCHQEGLSFGSDHTATKLPDSHYIDLLTGTRSETLQGTRYYCLLCHVPQAAEPPLR